MKHITKRPFEIYLPGTKTTAPRLLKTIEVEVENRFGHEVLTLKSRKEIERIRTRAMGLMSGEDIKALRKHRNLSQKQLTELLDCGEKTLSRWENGHGYPTGANNKLLRLLYEGLLAPASLRAVDSPLPDTPRVEEVWLNAASRHRPLTYFQPDRDCPPLESVSIHEPSDLELVCL